MRNYIELDGLKYKAPGDGWNPPTPQNPSTVRRTLLGEADVTFSAELWLLWSGEIEGPVTAPGEGWGTDATLQASLRKKTALAYTDHYGTVYNVVAQGPFTRRSLMNMWDNAGNTIYTTVNLVEV